jgi:hypothetical protein
LISSYVLNPLTGELSFGTIPQLKLAGLAIPEARIHLHLGRHIGPNRGFGVRHIWAEHKAEILRAGYVEESDVPRYVLEMLKPGTPPFFEGQSWGKTRLMAVRSAKGTAIVELREQREAVVWAVVTAFSGTRTHGTRALICARSSNVPLAQRGREPPLDVLQMIPLQGSPST